MAALDHILERHSVWRGGRLSASASATPTGFEALDRELPGGGWPRGTLTELLVGRAGIGELRLVLPALAALSWAGRRIAWLAPPHLPYAPALAQARIALEHCLVIRPARNEDALWAAEQAMRSGACGAVLAWLGESVDYAILRRLEMAAEAGRTMALVFRSTAAERTSTPAHLRVVVAHDDGALAIRIPKRRGPPMIESIKLEIGRKPSPKPERELRSNVISIHELIRVSA